MLKRLLKYVSGDRAEEVKKESSLASGSSEIRQTENSIYDQRCIAILANIISKSNIRAYSMDTSGTPQEVENSETLALLNNPSPGRSLVDLLSVYVKDISIHNRFWSYYIPDLNSLFVMNPEQIRYDLKNGILDKVKNGQKEIETDNIIYIQNNATEDSWSGNAQGVSGSAKNTDLDALYKIEGSARTLAQSRLANAYAIGGVVTTDEGTILTKERRDEIETDLNARYQGPERGGKVFFSEGIKFQSTFTGDTSPEYINYTDGAKRELISYRGIPEILLTGNIANATNYSTAQVTRFLYQNNVNPLLELFIESLNIQLVPLIEDGIYLDYIDQAPDDIEEISRTLTPLYENGSITLNELRIPMGFPEVASGNTFIGGEISETVPKNIIEDMKNKARADRINRTILKRKKIERDVEKVKEYARRDK